MSNELINTISETDLHAYVDQQLDPTRRAQVEDYLTKNPEAAEQVRMYQQQIELMHAAFDEILVESVPKYLQKTGKPRRNNSLQYSMVAAAMVMGIGVGWLGHGEFTPQQTPAASVNLVAQAAVAHAVYVKEVLHPVEVGADQQEHLVKWLSKRLNAPVRAPHLQTIGYQLEGGRLLPGDKGPAAQFMYRDADGQRLTLYLSTELQANEDTAFRYALEGKVSVFYWIDSNVAYALSGEVSREKLLSIAQSVYHELNQ